MAKLLDGTRIYGNATVDSNLVISGNYAATSTTTGSLQLTGGAGITGNLYVGGNLSIAGNTTFINTTTITTTDTIAAPTINAGTIGNSGATFTGTSATLTGAVQANTHTGIAVYAGTIGNSGATLTGTLSTAAQTNITSVGTLTGLVSSANITAQTANVYAANIIGNTAIYGAAYYYPNGSLFTGLKQVTSNNAPVTANFGDQWYQGNTDVLYIYIKDANNNPYWLDISSSPNTFANITVSGQLNVNNFNANTFSGAAVYAGTIGNTGANLTGATVVTTGNIYSGGNIIAASGTTSTTTTTGALVVSGSGGVGVGGNVNAGGYLVANGAFNENTTTPGVYIGNLITPRIGFFNGNAAANWQIDNYNGSFRWYTPGTPRMTIDYFGNLTIPGATFITNAAVSTSSSTGALVVSGGAGIAGNLYVGGNLSIAGNTTFINTTTITTTDTIAAPIINAGTIGNTGATFTGAGATFTTLTSSTHTPSANLTYNLGSTSSSWQNLYVGSIISSNGGSSGTSAITITNYNTYGSAGYAGMFTLTNTYPSATTPNKYIRLNSAGGIEVVNSAYNAVIFTIADSGATTVGGTLTPGSNNAVTLGSASAYWSTVYGVSFVGTSTTAKYADLAEMYHSDDYYASGTVMIFGGDYDVTVSTQSHDTAVAGVVSTNPAYLMNDNFESDNWLPIALTGKVPCMVRGPVAKGTLLVSSDQKGVACAFDKSLYEPGCIIGKSMDIILDDSVRKIEIAVGRF